MEAQWKQFEIMNELIIFAIPKIPCFYQSANEIWFKFLRNALPWIAHLHKFCYLQIEMAYLICSINVETKMD